MVAGLAGGFGAVAHRGEKFGDELLESEGVIVGADSFQHEIFRALSNLDGSGGGANRLSGVVRRFADGGAGLVAR